MKKLTAEKCRERIEELEALQERGFLSLNGEQSLQAMQIALPILEQQSHESVIAEQLEAVRDSLALTPHQSAIISCAIDRINVLTKRSLDVSRELAEQQESQKEVSHDR